MIGEKKKVRRNKAVGVIIVIVFLFVLFFCFSRRVEEGRRGKGKENGIRCG